MLWLVYAAGMYFIWMGLTLASTLSEYYFDVFCIGCVDSLSKINVTHVVGTEMNSNSKIKTVRKCYKCSLWLYALSCEMRSEKKTYSHRSTSNSWDAENTNDS